VKLQANQCTYSDLDCLLDSLISTNLTLGHLIKIMFVCSSTLVYLVLSTYLFTNTVILMKTLLLSSTPSSSSSSLPLFSANTCQNHHSSLPMLVVHERSGILESEDNESEVQPIMRYCEPSMYLPVSVVENNTIENDEIDDLLYRPDNSSNTIDWSLLGLFSRNHLKATSNFIEVF
jgi:hypothetical protein